MVGLLAGIILLSFGPCIAFGGQYRAFILPFSLIRHIPLLRNILPGRLTIYTDLLSAVIVALYLAQASEARRSRATLLAFFSAFFIMPRPHPVSAPPDLAFFAPGEVTRALGDHPRLLILPWEPVDESSYWQMESQFSFTQSGGYLGMPSSTAQQDELRRQMHRGETQPLAAELARYCEATHTQYVIATPKTPGFEREALEALGWPHRRIDDVTVYAVPPS